MKVVHGSLRNLLNEVRAKKLDVVRVAAFMQTEAIPTNGIPRYAAWVVVTARLDFDLWTEWRLTIGRGTAEITEKGAVAPARIAQLMTERLHDVRARITDAGVEMSDGMLTHDAESLDGALD